MYSICTLYHQIRESAIFYPIWSPNPSYHTKFRNYPTMSGLETFPLSTSFDSWPKKWKIPYFRRQNFDNFQVMKGFPISKSEKDSLHLANCIYLQEIGNQVNSLSTDFFPWVWRVHECSILNLFINVFVLIERESTW